MASLKGCLERRRRPPRCSTSTPRFINAVGFAVIGGTLVNVTGTPVTFSNDGWVWGRRGAGRREPRTWPALVLGSWLRLRAIGRVQDQELGEFSNADGPLTSSGVAFLNTREQITNQSGADDQSTVLI
jgi:hypothetical protein